jgi:carbon-monoxide dehydrogenase large subunit
MKFGIGQAITRIEDERLLTGRGQYVDDLSFPNESFLVFVRSPHAHARVMSIDVAAARSQPGVLAVLTGADLAADGVGAFPINPSLKNAAGKPMSAPPYAPLATDIVRYVGQAVAAVVAESRAAAERAANEIFVDYAPLDAVTSTRDAIAAGAVALWPDAPGNVAAVSHWGDAARCDAAFARAAHITRVVINNQRLAPVTLEPRAGAALVDASSGRVTYHASSQNPAGFQKTIAEMLKLAPADVRVRVGDVGGGFGMKTMVYAEDIVCVYAARELKRPVRWRATRNEEFQAASHGRDQQSEAELAFDGEGRILGLRVRLLGGIGAYGYGPAAIINLAVGPKVITGVYHVPTLDLRAQAVLTNTNVVSAYRGAGRPESIYLIERLMDQAAAELKLDPAELRRRNLIAPTAMPYKTPMGETFDSGDFPNILARALTASDWNGFAARRRESEARGKLRGRAVSTFLEWTGVVHEESIRLTVEADGRVRVFTAMQAMGQGIETSYVQILSETLQIDASRIDVVQGDSDVAGHRQHGQPLAVHRRLGDVDGLEADHRRRQCARGERSGSRARGHCVSRRPLQRRRHRSGHRPRRAGGKTARPAPGRRHHTKSRRTLVAQWLSHLRSRDRSRHRRCADRALHHRRRRGPRGQSADRRRPGSWRTGAGRRPGAAGSRALRRRRSTG